MGDDEHVQLEFNFSTTDINMYARRDHYVEPIYDTEDLPFKTLGEFERHYYITNQQELCSLWNMVSDLEDALRVSAELSR